MTNPLAMRLMGEKEVIEYLQKILNNEVLTIKQMAYIKETIRIIKQKEVRDETNN